MTRDLSETQLELLIDGLDDYLNLWDIEVITRGHFPDLSDSHVRKAAFEEIKALLLQGYVVSGFPTRDGNFVPLDTSVPAVLERIDSEWLQHRDNVNVNVFGICWFDVTDKGKQVAESSRL